MFHKEGLFNLLPKKRIGIGTQQSKIHATTIQSQKNPILSNK